MKAYIIRRPGILPDLGQEIPFTVGFNVDILPGVEFEKETGFIVYHHPDRASWRIANTPRVFRYSFETMRLLYQKLEPIGWLGDMISFNLLKPGESARIPHWVFLHVYQAGNAALAQGGGNGEPAPFGK
ncbi:MAG: hypothetical protein AAGK02_16210 [Pseudomonadota bacterium]